MVEKARMWNRRQFLSSLAAMGVALSGKPPRVLGAATGNKLKLGFDNFSIRAFGWKAPRLVEYASELNVDTLLLSDLDVYESLDEGYLRKVRAQAKRALHEWYPYHVDGPKTQLHHR